MKVIQEYQVEDKVLEFLMGPNESYLNARSQILLQDPLPNVNKVFACIIQEEKQRGIIIPQVESNQPSNDNPNNFAGSTHANHGNNRSDNQFDNKPVCSHCGVPGHTHCGAETKEGSNEEHDLGAQCQRLMAMLA
uniref:Uncharacterized protein n=1 Tax=Cannabis sativa TaxID=3483 RepID=A0A803NH13_CANSA